MLKSLATLSMAALICMTAEAQVFHLKQAEKMIPGTETLRYTEKSSAPDFVRFAKGSEIPTSQAESWIRTNYGFTSNDALTGGKEERDQMGMTHYRYGQKYNNIPVENGMVIVHSKNGKLVSINGTFIKGLQGGSTPSLPEKVALKYATDNINASVYMWQIPGADAELQRIMKDPSLTYTPKGELVYVSGDGTYTPASYRLAYKFDVYAAEPMSRHYVYVDASNGNILSKVDRIHHYDVSNTAETVYKGTQSIVADWTGSQYRLRETGRGNGIETYDLNQGTNYASAVDFTDADGYWNNVNAQQDEYATDAHLGTERTYDFFLNNFGRNSIDNAGFSLISYVHYSSGYNNAFWNGSYMTYGDGDGSYFTPLMSVDVCGHEVTHGLTNFTANLVYAYEPGALNESFSDIFGNCVEYFTDPGDFSWSMGEDITPSNLGIRNMANPNDFSNPDTYHGTYWEYSSYDNGGVHINSGVQNYWFYLLTTGGSGTNDNGDPFSVSGIGISDAQAIAFRNLTVYLTTNSQYADAAFYANQSAADLFGNNSNQQIQCNNAWYAVGIGSSTPTGDDPAPYCAVSYTVDCTDDDYINNFNFNTIANYNTGCSLLGYDNTGISTTVNPGQSFTFNASFSGLWNEALAIWIDFNFDNDFADAGEMVYNGTTAAASHTGTITIPSNNAYGTARMRVSCAFTSSSITFPADGCGFISYYGETEDYIVNIVDPVCAVSYDYGCQYGDYIDNFSFNTINETGTGCSGNGYVLSSSTTSVIEGQSYTFATQYAYWSQALAVYIDFNQDLDFNDYGEMVFMDLNSTSGHSGSIAIPAGTPSGMHRMRVMCQYNASSFPSDGCGYVGYYGETQDYDIEVLPAAYPYCSTSTDYNCYYYTNIDDFTFNTIQDIGSGCNNYTGYTNTGLSTTVTTGSTVPFTSAHYNYPMMLAIYMDMNQDDDFADAGEMVFVDYNADFTHAGNIAIPTGAQIGAHRMRVLAVYDYNASIPADGCGYFGVYGEVQDYTVWVAANAGPDIALCSGAIAYMNADLPANSTGLWTKIAGNGNIITPTSPTTQVKSLTSSSSTFVWTVTQGNNWSQDTMYIRKADVPTNVTVTSYTATSVTFSWTAAVDPDSFHIRINENCTTVGGLNFRVAGNQRSFTINNLKGCTNYCIRVRSQCPNNVYTAWSQMSAPFTTSGPVSCAAITNLVITPVQGCVYNLDWSSGCAAADSFRVRYRVNNGNWQITIPGTTSTNRNLTLGQGNWEFRVQTWCNGQNVATSATYTYNIGSCVIPYSASVSQNTGCNYKIQWQTCAPSDSFRVRYRVGANAFVSSPYTTGNFVNLNLGVGTWEYRVQSWCGGILMGVTPSYFTTIGSCRSAGVSQEVVSNMVLFPNPTTSRSLLNFSSEIDGDYTIAVSDISGRVLNTIQGSAVVGENTAEILVDGYAKGVYFVGLTLNGETRQIKLTVQ